MGSLEPRERVQLPYGPPRFVQREGLGLDTTQELVYNGTYERIKTMKAKDIQIGATYRAKVSGNLVDVQIIRMQEDWKPCRRSASGYRSTFYWIAKNLQTGRMIRIKSAQRLRYKVGG